MKQVIRHRITGKFLDAECKWTADLNKARSFSHIEEAEKTTRILRLRAVELYCCVEHGAQDSLNFTLPLAEIKNDLPRRPRLS